MNIVEIGKALTVPWRQRKEHYALLVPKLYTGVVVVVGMQEETAFIFFHHLNPQEVRQADCGAHTREVDHG